MPGEHEIEQPNYFIPVELHLEPLHDVEDLGHIPLMRRADQSHENFIRLTRFEQENNDANNYIREIFNRTRRHPKDELFDRDEFRYAGLRLHDNHERRFEEVYRGVDAAGMTELARQVGFLATLEDRKSQKNMPKLPSREDLANPDWLVENAEHVPAGWNKRRLGAIIKNRLEKGIDANVHDATYWLVEFECPEERDGETMFSDTDETALVLSRLFGQNPEKLPTKPTRIEKLFHNKALADVYTKAIEAIEGTDDFDIDAFAEEHIPRTLVELRDYIMLCKRIGLRLVPEEQTALLERLRGMSQRRETYINDAQNWLQTHSTTPRKLLITAWSNRDMALAAGVDDNPTAIRTWADSNTVLLAFNALQAKGEAPDNLSAEDFETYGNLVSELMRCYDASTVVKTLSWHKEHFNPEVLIPSFSVDFEDGWTAEILTKDDPRGYTIGYDSGCCMTVGGKADKCVRAGYSDPRYGFVAFYKEGKLVGQSLLYTNNDEDPEKLVVDNIEITLGRDRDEILEKYTKFFDRYIENDELPFTSVTLGVHKTEWYQRYLHQIPAVATPIEGTYTDARRQFLLTTREKLSERIQFNTLTPANSHEVAEMELRVYGDADGNYSDFHDLESELSTHEKSFSYVLVDNKNNSTPAGYMIAYTDARYNYVEGSDENDEVLYVDDLAIMPEHQQSGLGWEALRTILKIADQQELPVVFHAKDDTSWMILQTRTDRLKEMGYDLTVLEADPDYLDEGVGAHLVLLTKVV